ncbi:uncharacterized protein BJ171DRAFT_501186 [Polychytrium aggregatum]|uniref:uncharacterized protein n=1 Tax=Polychytrium aggregatum TaxID=110093 RepID=UPI0022FF242D|nr:uncharacterized protein BJ171DRAFT_501186 [Polychytrium aggregatum]KAI9205689.1 hypothetical protein BJ171DRAFT_501186 [Polychytrium aggregatum]
MIPAFNDCISAHVPPSIRAGIWNLVTTLQHGRLQGLARVLRPLMHLKTSADSETLIKEPPSVVSAALVFAVDPISLPHLGNVLDITDSTDLSWASVEECLEKGSWASIAMGNDLSDRAKPNAEAIETFWLVCLYIAYFLPTAPSRVFEVGDCITTRAVLERIVAKIQAKQLAIMDTERTSLAPGLWHRCFSDINLQVESVVAEDTGRHIPCNVAVQDILETIRFHGLRQQGWIAGSKSTAKLSVADVDKLADLASSSWSIVMARYLGGTVSAVLNLELLAQYIGQLPTKWFSRDVAVLLHDRWTEWTMVPGQTEAQGLIHLLNVWTGYLQKTDDVQNVDVFEDIANSSVFAPHVIQEELVPVMSAFVRFLLIFLAKTQSGGHHFNRIKSSLALTPTMPDIKQLEALASALAFFMARADPEESIQLSMIVVDTFSRVNTGSDVAQLYQESADGFIRRGLLVSSLFEETLEHGDAFPSQERDSRSQKKWRLQDWLVTSQNSMDRESSDGAVSGLQSMRTWAVRAIESISNSAISPMIDNEASHRQSTLTLAIAIFALVGLRRGRKRMTSMSKEPSKTMKRVDQIILETLFQASRVCAETNRDGKMSWQSYVLQESIGYGMTQLENVYIPRLAPPQFDDLETITDLGARFIFESPMTLGLPPGFFLELSGHLRDTKRLSTGNGSISAERFRHYDIVLEKSDRDLYSANFSAIPTMTRALADMLATIYFSHEEEPPSFAGLVKVFETIRNKCRSTAEDWAANIASLDQVADNPALVGTMQILKTLLFAVAYISEQYVQSSLHRNRLRMRASAKWAELQHQIFTTILECFYHLHFVATGFGSSMFPSWNHTFSEITRWIVARNIKAAGRSVRQATPFEAMMDGLTPEYRGSGVSNCVVHRCRLLFYQQLVRALLPIISDDVLLHQLLPQMSPYIVCSRPPGSAMAMGDRSRQASELTELFEASHMVCVGVVSEMCWRLSKTKLIENSRLWNERVRFIGEFTMWYCRTLLEHFPDPVDLELLRGCFRSIIVSISTLSRQSQASRKALTRKSLTAQDDMDDDSPDHLDAEDQPEEELDDGQDYILADPVRIASDILQHSEHGMDEAPAPNAPAHQLATESTSDVLSLQCILVLIEAVTEARMATCSGSVTAPESVATPAIPEYNSRPELSNLGQAPKTETVRSGQLNTALTEGAATLPSGPSSSGPAGASTKPPDRFEQLCMVLIDQIRHIRPRCLVPLLEAIRWVMLGDNEAFPRSLNLLLEDSSHDPAVEWTAAEDADRARSLLQRWSALRLWVMRDAGGGEEGAISPTQAPASTLWRFLFDTIASQDGLDYTRKTQCIGWYLELVRDAQRRSGSLPAVPRPRL